MIPDVVAKAGKSLGLAPECIATRPHLRDFDRYAARVDLLDEAVRHFEQTPRTRILFAEVSLILGKKWSTKLELFEHPGTLVGNLGEECTVGLNLVWKGFSTSRPAVRIHLHDGYTDGFSGEINPHGRLGRKWLGRLMQDSDVGPALLDRALEEHVEAARLFESVSNPRQRNSPDLEAVRILGESATPISRGYLLKLFTFDSPEVAKEAVNCLKPTEMADQAMFWKILDAACAKGHECLIEALGRTNVDAFAVSWAIESLAARRSDECPGLALTISALQKKVPA